MPPRRVQRHFGGWISIHFSSWSVNERNAPRLRRSRPREAETGLKAMTPEGAGKENTAGNTSTTTSSGTSSASG